MDLDLQGVPFISDRGLVAVLEHGLLHDLSLAECAVTDLTLQNIAKFCFASVIIFFVIGRLSFQSVQSVLNQ